MNYRKTNFIRTLILTSCLIVAHMFPAARAALTDLTDIPLAVRNLSQPNIMFMLDNSGSMSNIVPDSPFDPNVTYLSTCTSVLAGGVAAPNFPTAASYDAAIRNSDGSIRIMQGTAAFTFGATSACFNPTLRYNARLLGDTAATGTAACGANAPCARPGNYLSAVYTGNYLNWYFGLASSSYTNPASFAINAQRKAGTTTRLEIAQGAAISVINSLNNARVGLASYNGTTGGSLNEVISDLNAAKKTTMTTKINALTAANSTPLAETLSDIGRYFTLPQSSTSNLTLHPGNNPTTATIDTIFTTRTINNLSGVPTLTPPIQFYCQKSFAILLTDGRPQQDRDISTSLRDYTGDCAVAGICDSTSNGTNLAAGPLPNTASQNGTKTGRSYEAQGSDYLDDVAFGLFDMDLRPDLLAPTGQTKKNNLATYIIGFADLQVMSDPLLIDTANRGGSVLPFFPSNLSQLNTAFQTALENILAVDGASAAVAVANANVTSTDNNSYASSYNSGTWTGDLENFTINSTTGVVSTTATWAAQSLLDARTAANRYIATHNGSNGTAGAGIQFQPTTASTTTKLSATQQTLLNTPTTTDGAAVVAYLRGDQSGEVVPTPATYRVRAHLLGDIINAEPVVVRKPNNSFTDAGYSAFKTAQNSRASMVYQGANDGMLHAFVASSGAEEWAYVPNLVLPRLNIRTRKTGFMHEFYVDGTPVAGDLDFSNTAGVTGNPAPNWRTILVGGLNKGGRGYYALDITSPTLPNTGQEAAVAAKVLWEFPNSISNTTSRNSVTLNMGYSYGNPILVKTQNEGWVVLVTSGYNNGTGGSGGNGQGYLYILNAKTGDLIQSISTGVGTNTDPSGLAKISAYVEDFNLDNTATFVYGGDLKGNVWRFDLTGPKNTWNVRKITTLVDVNGNFQPVTTAPELARVNLNGTDRFLVYVGTGQYLGDTDLSGISGITPNFHATQTQSIYALLDDRTTSPTITNLRSSLRQVTITNGVASSGNINFPTQKGWYLDFSTGERLITDPTLASGALIFTSNTPSSTTCVPGGSSNLYFLDYATGGLIGNSGVSVIHFADALSSRPVLIKLESGVVDALTRKSNKQTVTTPVPIGGAPSGTRRINWREIINQ